MYCLIPGLYIAGVEEASPWAKRDKTDWSNEVRSSQVSFSMEDGTVAYSTCGTKREKR